MLRSVDNRVQTAPWAPGRTASLLTPGGSSEMPSAADEEEEDDDEEEEEGAPPPVRGPLAAVNWSGGGF